MTKIESLRLKRAVRRLLWTAKYDNKGMLSARQALWACDPATLGHLQQMLVRPL